MATETPNHKLIKPEMTDKADISMINPNWDTLDTALKAVEDRVESTETSIDLTSNIVKATDSPVDTLHLVRNGNIIYFQCVTKINNGWSYLGITLPKEARPVVSTPLSAGFGGQSDVAKLGHAIAMANGTIATLASSAITNNVTLSGTWIV